MKEMWNVSITKQFRMDDLPKGTLFYRSGS
jgi:hypothetical protein